MAMSAEEKINCSTAVPLCLPSNCKWNSSTCQVYFDANQPRGDVRICKKGLELLESIGTDNVAVVCITGPSRTGKSYFLSQIQDGVSFELGHSTTAKTTGIWVALGPEPLVVDGKVIRLVLLDAEGLGSTVTVDNDGNRGKWESKVFTIAALLSSYFIYNSKGVPTSDDLDKLGFLAQFGNCIKKGNAHGTSFNIATNFLWLIRDALLQPEVDNIPTDWKTYMDKSILFPSEGNTRRNAIKRAIRTLFHDFDVFGLPPPSVDKNVIQNLSLPRYRNNINPKFLDGIQEVKHVVLSRSKIKMINGNFVSGIQFSKLLSLLVTVVNKECNLLSFESIWEQVLSLKANDSFNEAKRKFEYQITNMKLPVSSRVLEACVADASRAARSFFQLETKSCSEDIRSRYEIRLNDDMEKAIAELKTKNFEMSRAFCLEESRKIEEVYLGPIERDLENHCISDLAQAKIKVMNVCKRKLSKFVPHNMITEVGERLGIKVDGLQIRITQTAITSVYAMYTREMSNLEEQMPCEQEQIQTTHQELRHLCVGNFREKCYGSKTFSEDCESIEKELRRKLKCVNDKNNCCSKEICEEIIKSLKHRYLNRLQYIPSQIKEFSDFKDAKQKIFDDYDKTAPGPAKEKVRGKYINEIEEELEREQIAIAQEALKAAEKTYKQSLNSLSKKDPIDETDLEEKTDFTGIRKEFERKCDFEDNLGQRYMKLLDEIEDVNKREFVMHNDQRSREMCENLMKSLIKDNLTHFINDITMIVDFEKQKQIILGEYQKRAKGTKVREVKEEYEIKIDRDIERGNQRRILKGLKITLEATAIITAASVAPNKTTALIKGSSRYD